MGRGRGRERVRVVLWREVLTPVVRRYAHQTLHNLYICTITFMAIISSLAFCCLGISFSISDGLVLVDPTIVGANTLARLEAGILLASEQAATLLHHTKSQRPAPTVAVAYFWRWSMMKASVSLLQGGSWATASNTPARATSLLSSSANNKI